MKTLTPKQWVVALLVSFLITGSLWALAMTYFLYLPGSFAVTVHKEDRSVVGQLYAIATNAFFIALFGGLVLGICLPVAYRWGRKRRSELTGASSAEPGASPKGGPAERLGNSGAGGGPPSVS
jgi:hypothetical protein